MEELRVARQLNIRINCLLIAQVCNSPLRYELIRSLTHLLTRLLDNLYIADFDNHRIRKVLVSTSVISTIAGTGTASYNGDNGAASSATLYYPVGVAVDTSGKLILALRLVWSHHILL